MLKENERLDDLQCNGFRVIQDPDGYCFTSDSVILANLASVKRTDRVVDLCSGSGVVALLLQAKHSPKEIVCVELQPRLADMAKRSVAFNNVQNTVKVVNAPLQGVRETIGDGYDVVIVNPPYETCEKKENPTEEEICRSEQKVTCEEVVSESARLLKFGGLFYMVNKSRRLADVMFYMKKYGVEPKKLYLIQPKKEKDVDAFVVEGKKGAKPYLVTPKPLVVYDENGDYTDEVRRLYNK